MPVPDPLRRRMMALPGALLAAGIAAPFINRRAHAQTWPTRPIRLIVPYSPGSGADVSARGIARLLPRFLGQEVIIENQPGGAAIPASLNVARAAPDGYTLLFSATQHAINPSFGPPLPYDSVESFTPVARLTSQPLLLAVSSTVPASNLGELIAYARARPGKLNYASTGVGSSIHLAGAFFASRAGLDVHHVAYKNAADALIDLVRGDVQWIFYPYQSVLSQLQSGRIRLLGSTAGHRSTWAPDVPTMAESGYPDFVLPAWQGIFGPAHLPASIAARLYEAFRAALSDPALVKTFEAGGTDIFLAGSDAFADFLRSEIARYRDIVRTSGARPD